MQTRKPRGIFYGLRGSVCKGDFDVYHPISFERNLDSPAWPVLMHLILIDTREKVLASFWDRLLRYIWTLEGLRILRFTCRLGRTLLEFPRTLNRQPRRGRIQPQM